jgi:hypothetical protein
MAFFSKNMHVCSSMYAKTLEPEASFFFFQCWGFEPRTFCTLGKGSITEFKSLVLDFLTACLTMECTL